jgi:hypothetical protein
LSTVTNGDLEEAFGAGSRGKLQCPEELRGWLMRPIRKAGIFVMSEVALEEELIESSRPMELVLW